MVENKIAILYINASVKNSLSSIVDLINDKVEDMTDEIVIRNISFDNVGWKKEKKADLITYNTCKMLFPEMDFSGDNGLIRENFYKNYDNETDNEKRLNLLLEYEIEKLNNRERKIENNLCNGLINIPPWIKKITFEIGKIESHTLDCVINIANKKLLSNHYNFQFYTSTTKLIKGKNKNIKSYNK